MKDFEESDLWMSRELVNMMGRWKTDILCIQETRRKGSHYLVGAGEIVAWLGWLKKDEEDKGRPEDQVEVEKT